MRKWTLEDDKRIIGRLGSQACPHYSAGVRIVGLLFLGLFT
jgi:hypothetical protein